MENAIRGSVEALVGARIEAIRTASGGYSPAHRWIVDAGNESYFVKVGVPPVASTHLRHEAEVYRKLRLGCMPKVIGFVDDPVHPLLVLEDLTMADWPPPWRKSIISSALSAIADFQAIEAELPFYRDLHGYPEAGWWGTISANQPHFLALDVVTEAWFNEHVPVLVESELSESPDGTALTHFDLRSDNICFVQRSPRIIDWSHACLGNPKLDLGLFLPSLAADGGPLPESILDDEPGVAAWVAGFFAYHASKPFIRTAPLVRIMQRRLLHQALAWVRRALVI